MPIPLNILIVEDSPADAEILVDELRRAGYDPKWTRVQNELDFRAGLKDRPDLIFSDFTLPQFSVRRALELLRESRNPAPFIIVSGTIGEERAVESLKAGATDYVLKDTPARLGIAVERALREAKERSERQRVEHWLNSFFSGATAGLAIVDRERRYIHINETLAQMDGLSAEAHLGRTIDEILPDFARSVTPLLESVLRTGQPVLDAEITAPTVGLAGALRHWRASYFPIHGSAGRLDGVGCVVVETTARKQAEEARRISEERFRQLAENIDEVFWITDSAKNEMLYVSPAYETIWGRTCESLLRSPSSWFDAIHADDRERVKEAAAKQQNQNAYDEVYRITRPDGSVRWIHDRAFPVRDANSQVLRIVGLAEDITKQRELEEQFRHVQKMESIGQLAGGVAHDFNNILTVISGHASLLLADPLISEEAEESAEQISLASERAANLTRQLLTFSRRQLMQTRELDLDDVIESVIKMLVRVLGADINLEFTRSKLPPILADAGMLEQILMNLAVNARDAMPKGGTLTICTGTEMIDELFVKQNPEASGGEFVWISVTDTGVGISPRDLSKIFDPFFTTKEVGKGTGLGLATVYGIVKQHRGWINVQSKLRKGTTFKIYFPATVARGGTPAVSREEIKIRGGRETILLVEDEKAVRQLVSHVLGSFGYNIIEADCGKTALEQWQRHAKIDLLLTDLVMPGGMSGRELADTLRLQHPKLRIIFMSGYSAEVVGRDFRLREGVNFLQKPYAPRALAKCVRDCLDSSQV
jgi:two-component system cell cycle sensor histidine kinase/response regulator CckA